MVVVRGSEEGLGGDAADVQASAAEGAAGLDADRLEAKLGGFDGGDVPAGTAANDADVVVVEEGGGGGVATDEGAGEGAYGEAGEHCGGFGGGG